MTIDLNRDECFIIVCALRWWRDNAKFERDQWHYKAEATAIMDRFSEDNIQLLAEFIDATNALHSPKP